jgi:N-glycosylase/DNA lyase
MILNISEEDRKNIYLVLKKFSETKSKENIFYDLCFAICAPQTTFKSNRKVIDELIRRDFYNKNIELEELKTIIRPVRFLRKAQYLLDAKIKFLFIDKLISDNYFSEHQKRTWLVKNIKGLGYKASSHFLRNLGAQDLAIIDTHIIKFMNIENFLSKNYLTVENNFRKIAVDNNLSIAGLDAYIWKIRSNTNWSEFVF